MEPGAEHCRLADLVLAVAVATDLGTGQPVDHVLRTTLRAQRLGALVGASPDEQVATYWLTLLRFIGCTATAHDDARAAGGDELSFYAGAAPLLMGEGREFLRFLVRDFAAGQSSLRRARLVLGMLANPKGAEEALRVHCDAGQLLARRVGLDDAVGEALGCAFERWDGKGYPNRIAGEAIPRPCRVAVVARDVELLVGGGGWDLVAEVLGRRRDRAYEPALVDAVLEAGPDDADDVFDAEVDLAARTLDAEPGARRMVPESEIQTVLEAWGDFVDLKSPWAHGHSRRVGELAAAAGEALGLDADDVRRLRWAGLVHDLGHVGVPAGIRATPGALTTEEWERVRLHPYLTERILRRSPALRPLAPIAASHHERLDASGYHRGVGRGEIDELAMVVAVADAWDGARHARAHREASDATAATKLLDAEVDAGRLDGRITAAVLAAAGRPVTTRTTRWPAGLTDREVEVLGLLTTGRSNKQVAHELGISPKTVGRHVEHVYAKAGVSTRAAAVLFAMEHGLARDRPAGVG